MYTSVKDISVRHFYIVKVMGEKMRSSGTAKTSRILSIVFLVLLISGCSLRCSVKERTVKGNLILDSKPSDFKNGVFGNTVLEKTNGEIQLKKSKGEYLTSGLFTSDIINTEAFNNALISCNADTPEGTSVKIELQVLVDGKWSDWLMWGTWGTSIKSGSNLASPEDELALMDPDIFYVKGENKTASALKYRLTLNTEDRSVTPSVRLVAVSAKNNSINADKPVNGNGKSSEYENFQKVLKVPAISQMTRDPKIAGNICSATSMTMVMNYYGIDVLPEENAWGIFDYKALLFGNSAFACTYAGNYGFTSYLCYCNSLDDLRKEISNGNPVIASVKYKNDEGISGDLPVLHGAPISKTEGHIVVVCGFVRENGKEYVVVNDPAGSNDESVEVKYLAGEFENAWVKRAYIVHKDNRKLAERQRIPAVLEPTGNKREYQSNVSLEYNLKLNKSVVDLKNARTIMATKDGVKYDYISQTSGNTIWFDGYEGKGKYKLLFIMDNNKTYTAEVDSK